LAITTTMEDQRMKTFSGIKLKWLVYGFSAVLLGSASPVSAASADDDIIAQTASGVPYVSGGIGTESLDRLGSIVGDFNLKLVFALKSGEFVSGVRVVIADAKGKTILDATSEGPWFLAKLPPGNYRVAATLSGREEQRQIAVAATKLRTVDFRWDEE
jgi:hypothetical protein